MKDVNQRVTIAMEKATRPLLVSLARTREQLELLKEQVEEHVGQLERQRKLEIAARDN